MDHTKERGLTLYRREGSQTFMTFLYMEPEAIDKNVKSETPEERSKKVGSLEKPTNL